MNLVTCWLLSFCTSLACWTFLCALGSPLLSLAVAPFALLSFVGILVEARDVRAFRAQQQPTRRKP